MTLNVVERKNRSPIVSKQGGKSHNLLVAHHHQHNQNTSKGRSSKNSAALQRATTRAFTQMSGDNSGAEFNIDLRHEVSASAKLEELKAKYKRQAAAVQSH